jgi:hypothetical protein
MSVVITADQVLPIRAGSFTDREGNAAQIDGAPVWTSSDATVAELVVDADGFGALVVSHKAGEALITMKADALVGEGTVDVVAALAVVVTAGQTVAVGINAGEAVSKDAAPAEEPAPVEPPAEEPAPVEPPAEEPVV